MNKTLRWTLLTALVILVIIIGYRKWKLQGDGLTKVTTEKAALRTIVETVNASGKIYPENEIKITPEFSGQVTELKISEGDYVRKGQLLARIGNRTSIEAPMDGIVSSLKVKKGESVAGNTFNVGTEMMTVSDMSVLELRVDVGESDIVKVQVGDTAEVQVDAYNDRIFKGVVSQIANSTRSNLQAMAGNDVTEYQVKIRLDTSSYSDLKDTSKSGNPLPFRPGMNASASIRTTRLNNILSVPITAINTRVKDDSSGTANVIDSSSNAAAKLEEVVFVLENNMTVRKVVVKSGIQDINYIEVKRGLAEGDNVITGPYTAVSRVLQNGTRVKVVARDKLFEK